MITCHDHQLIEIVIGGLRGNSPAVREGLQTSAGNHSRYTRGGVGTGLPKGTTVRVGTHTMCI